MLPSEAIAYGEAMRERGIAEIEIEYIVEEFPRGEGQATCAVAVPRVKAIRLLPHWTPETPPDLPPRLDDDPQANALAQQDWQKKRAARERIEAQATEDRIRFAHTEGV